MKFLKNVPNSLSIFRIILSLFVPFLLYTNSFLLRIWAFVIFIVATITDILDGFIARKFNVITNFGKIVDPIADKLLVFGFLTTLILLKVIPWWVLIPLVIREISVTGFRFYFLKKGKAVAAITSGKIKTAVQITTLILGYIVFMYRNYFFNIISKVFGEYLIITLDIFIFLTIYMTLHSGTKFFIKNWKLIKD